jgi:hypothetical protein
MSQTRWDIYHLDIYPPRLILKLLGESITPPKSSSSSRFWTVCVYILYTKLGYLSSPLWMYSPLQIHLLSLPQDHNYLRTISEHPDLRTAPIDSSFINRTATDMGRDQGFFCIDERRVYIISLSSFYTHTWRGGTEPV